jgi:hypothetical protein
LASALLAFLHDFVHVSDRSNLEDVAVGQSRMAADELYGVIHVARLKDENAAELFFGFDAGAVGGCDFAVLPGQGKGGLRPLNGFSVDGSAELFGRGRRHLAKLANGVVQYNPLGRLWLGREGDPSFMVRP